MKRTLFLNLLLISILFRPLLSGAEAEMNYTEIYNSDTTYETTKFQHTIDSIDTGATGHEVMVVYDGYQPAYRSDTTINSLQGTGTLLLSGSSVRSMNVFHLSAEAADSFSGNIKLENYSTAFDDELRYDSGAILELAGGKLEGSVLLQTILNTNTKPWFITALGITADTTLGGLDSADHHQPTTYLYSGSIHTDNLPHEAIFSTGITPAAHTLTIDTAGNHHFHGSIVGPLSIIKKGSGTQSFTGNPGSGTHFTVQAGILQLDNTNLTRAGNISISGQASFSHKGDLNTPILTMQGGSLEVSGTFTAGSATFTGHNSLSATESSGNSWNLTLTADSSSPLTLSGTASVESLHITYSSESLARGWYRLISGGTLSAGSITANGQSARTEQRVDGLYLYVADGSFIPPRDEATELVWQGTNGTWQNGHGHNENNWNSSSGNNNFMPGDSVVFEQAAQIELVGELAPAQVEVNHTSGTLELNGSGCLTGTATIAKSGGGELILATANTHSGSTTITGGTLTAGHAQAFGTGTVIMLGGTLNLSGKAVTSTLQIRGTASLAETGAFGGNIDLQSGSLSTASLGSGSISCSGTATLISTGELVLNRQIANTGELTLQGIFDATALASSVDATMIDALGNSGGNSGFVRDAGSELRLTTGGQLHAGEAVILLHGKPVEPDTAGFATLPGTTHRDHYLIAAGHSVSTAQIKAAAGNELRRISLQGGTLHINTITDTLQAESGLVQLHGARLTGGLGGTTRLETAGQAELGGANTYSGGTTICSGSLRITHGKALGSGEVRLGSHARSDAPLLDLADLPVTNDLQLSSGSSSLSGLENYRGNIRMEPDARVTIQPGSVLTLAAGQSLTLAAGGNTIQGHMNLAGGTIIFSGGPLTLHGLLHISSGATLDLRAWQNLKTGDTLLELDSASGIDTGLLTLLLPEEMTGSLLQFDTRTGRLSLTREPAPAPLPLDSLNRNQLAIYRTIISGSNLEELRARLATCTEAAALQQFLDRAGGAEYADLLPGIMEGALTHLRQLRRSTGSGFLLSAGSRTTVAVHAVTQRSSSEVRERSAWGARLQAEQRLSPATTLGISLESGTADTTPETATSTLRENFTFIDLYSTHRRGHWQFTASAGLGIHEFDPGARNTDAPAATSCNFALELCRDIPLSASSRLQPYLACDATGTRLTAIRESGGNAALQSRELQATTANFTTGLRWNRLMPGGSRIQLHAAITAATGDTAPALSMHFAGAPQQPYTLHPEKRDRLTGELGAGISHPLTPATTLHADAAARMGNRQNGFEAQAGLIFRF